MNVLDAQAMAEENADLKRQLAELRNTHNLVTSMLNETLRLPEPLDLVEMPGRVAAAFGQVKAAHGAIVKRMGDALTYIAGSIGAREHERRIAAEALTAVAGMVVEAVLPAAGAGCETEDLMCNDCGGCGKREILALEAQGHTYHCAARQVWADGQCECNLRGEVPGLVSREILKVAAGEVPADGPLFLGVDLAAGPDQTVVAFSEDFQTRDGEAAAHALDGEWLQPSTNPFGHGCCDCGLYHDVEWRLVDRDGDPIDLEELSKIYEVREEFAPISLQLAFTRNETETARLRAHQAGEVCESCRKALVGEDLAAAAHDSEDGVYLCKQCHGELVEAEKGEV